MTKVKMFIIEDDFIHASKLSMYLEEMGYALAGTATHAKEALNMIAATKPDLLLTDIHLEGDKDGIEIVEYLNDKNPIPVIFITSYSNKETMDRAKRTDPYAYIVKPYDKATLQAAIELAVYKFSKTTDFIGINKSPQPIQGWEEDQLIKGSIFVKSMGKLIKVKINDILYIEVKDKMCLIGIANEVLEVRIALQKLQEKLTGNRFLRIHRSFIVNKEAITSVDPGKSEVIIQGHTIPIGRSFREAFLNSLDTLNN